MNENKILKLVLNKNENIPDLIPNTESYNKIIVSTLEDKYLDLIDFKNLNNLKIPNIDLHQAVAYSIPDNAFRDSHWINTFIYPKDIKSIGEYAFYNCVGVSGDLIIPNSVETIGKYAFCECSGFNGKIHISNSLKYISEGVFKNCFNLKGDLIIPDSVTTIFTTLNNESPFSGCSKLNGDLSIGSGLTIIESGMFSNTNFKGKLILKEGIKVIGSLSFYNHKFSGDLIIPNSTNIIGSAAFYGCNQFDGELIIGEGINLIGSKAFHRTTSIKNITLKRKEDFTCNDYKIIKYLNEENQVNINQSI